MVNENKNSNKACFGIKGLNKVVKYDEDCETVNMEDHISWLMEEEMKYKCWKMVKEKEETLKEIATQLKRIADILQQRLKFD